MPYRLLVVDDDPDILTALKETLADSELEIATADHGSEALLQLDERQVDVLLTDLVLPDISGMDIIRRVQEYELSTLCILMTGHATVDNAVEALKSGIFDYVVKPFKAAEIRHVVQQALQRQKLVSENRDLQNELTRLMGLQGLVGRSKPMQEIFKIIDRVKDLDAIVLITGESGTGKEVLARALHSSGNRAKKPFEGINCGAMPENLIEDELFGHVKGAFTDAHAPRQGIFDKAEGGILFLDEIGTLRTDLQVKLLRVIQEREYRPIGSPNTRQIDVRVIAATNADLKEAVAKGEFREDLYYRLNIIRLHLPPLRERPEDILPLVELFVKRVCQRTGTGEKEFSRKAFEALLEYPWPGNVRELENVVERAIILSESPDQIELADLPPEVRWYNPAGDEGGKERASLPTYVENLGLDAYLRRAERAVIIEALQGNKWMKSRAARLLKLKRTTLVERMKRLDIPLKKDSGAEPAPE